ncbi:MAG: hypothetical protein CL853_02240 [Crocinitomicaceae bacterium]|nr:hypothetical protein [Crocinitomicaceae bacterium]
MKKYFIALSLIVLSCCFHAQNQNEIDINEVQPEILTIGLGTGYNSFFGDYVKPENVSPFTNIRSAYFITIEKRLGKTFSIQLNGSKGYVSDNERSIIVQNNRNFESDLLQIGTNFILNFDNDLLIKRKSTFAPYIAAGFSFLKFDSYGDLIDGDNNTYHYWDNGQIWNVSQSDTSSSETQLVRDYSYETLLTDSITEYSRTSFAIPLTLGFKFKLNNTIDGRIFGTYNLALTDWIDNASENDNNDKFAFIGFSINYKFRKANKAEKEKYKDVDLKMLNSADQDNDGVEDLNDNCSQTPNGVKVDEKGCPVDDDFDGVPNYLDQQLNTPKGANVDELGREITDSLINDRIFLRDSIETETNKVFSDTTETGSILKGLNRIENDNSIEPEIKKELIALLSPADSNKDGRLSKDEITLAINSFFDGNDNFTVENLYDLIDYYFDQN